MNCAEWERLSDAYLDGLLCGSLRLEFDTHRVNCHRCQQTLAMLETCEHVIASDHRMPAMSDDFTARVMAQIQQRAPRPTLVGWRPLRWVAASALPAAAVLAFVLLPTFRGAPVTTVRSDGPAPREPEIARMDNVDRHEYYVDMIFNRVDQARASLASDIGQLARYPLGITLPRSVARASEGLDGTNPLWAFFEALAPAKPDSDDTAPGDTDHYTL